LSLPADGRRVRVGTTFARAMVPVSDAEAEFTWFFRTEFTAVVRSVYLILHDQERARDIAQDAFIQLLTHWSRVSKYDRPDAWVRRVAIRMAMRAARRERLRASLEREVDPATVLKPVDLDLVRAVQQLPPKQRAAIVLFYFEDRPISEVAEIMSCSEVAAKVSLHRGRKALAELIGSEEVSDVP